MRSTIVSATDADAWRAMIRRVGASDFYDLPEYHRLYDFLGGRSLAYAAWQGDDCLFHPFLLRSIERVGNVDIAPGWHDIETVYGYTGPVATTASPDFLAEAWQGFETWCSEQNVVSEFLRFSPWLGSERFAAPRTEVRLDRPTVEIRLEGGEDAIWQSYTSSQRTKVRKATKCGLIFDEIALDEGLAIFRDIYEGAMQRMGAADFYTFPDSYYQDLRRTLSDHVKLFVVKKGQDPIAADMAFTYGKIIHSHLSASRQDALHLAPNNLMLHQISLWGHRHGFERVHLGGGRSRAPDDALLRFKKAFSPHTLSFYVGERIHDSERYAILCDLWRDQAAGPPPAGYFRPYRLQPSACRPAA